MLKRNPKSWIDKKLANPKFRKKFEEEYQKLSISEQLIRMRLKAELTQAQVARRANTTASAISRYENANYDRYELQTLQRIASACGGELKVVLELKDKKAA